VDLLLYYIGTDNRGIIGYSIPTRWYIVGDDIQKSGVTVGDEKTEALNVKMISSKYVVDARCQMRSL